MAKILTTKGSAAALEDLIRRADKDLYLISFSFIISESFIVRLQQASEKGININLVYGKSIKSDTKHQLEDIPNLRIYFFNNLHAKLFANETKCIIGSMNFSEASEINNTELGVLLSSANDKEAFDDAMLHCKEIVRAAELEFEGVRGDSLNIKNVSKANFQSKVTVNNNNFMGYCIRTGKRIPLNHERPFSQDAYYEWAEWGNEDYAEKFCHFSGEKSKGMTSKSNPVLSKNWKEYQRVTF